MVCSLRCYFIFLKGVRRAALGHFTIAVATTRSVLQCIYALDIEREKERDIIIKMGENETKKDKARVHRIVTLFEGEHDSIVVLFLNQHGNLFLSLDCRFSRC